MVIIERLHVQNMHIHADCFKVELNWLISKSQMKTRLFSLI